MRRGHRPLPTEHRTSDSSVSGDSLALPYLGKFLMSLVYVPSATMF